jgi:hypothetical protein
MATSDPVEVISNLISDGFKQDKDFQEYAQSTYYINSDESLPRHYALLESWDDAAHELTPNIRNVSYKISLGCLTKNKKQPHTFEEKVRDIVGDVTRDPTSSFYSSSSIHMMEIDSGSDSQIVQSGTVIFNRELQITVKKQYVKY